MASYHPKADKRRRQAIGRVADRFDSDLLGDIVRDQLFYDDGPVLRLASVMEHAYNLSEAGDVESEAAEGGAFDAGNAIYDVLDEEAEAQAVAVMEDVVADRADIIEHHGADGRRAVHEASKRHRLGEVPEADDE